MNSLALWSKSASYKRRQSLQVITASCTDAKFSRARVHWNFFLAVSKQWTIILWARLVVSFSNRYNYIYLSYRYICSSKMLHLNNNCKLLKSCRLYRSLSTLSAKSRRDITGNYINLDSKTIILYDESITNFLTHENNPAKQLKQIFKIKKDIPMVNSLLVIQSVRQPAPSNHNEINEIEEYLSSLEKRMVAGNIS